MKYGNGIGVISELADDVRDMIGMPFELSSISLTKVAPSSFVPMIACTFLLFARSIVA